MIPLLGTRWRSWFDELLSGEDEVLIWMEDEADDEVEGVRDRLLILLLEVTCWWWWFFMLCKDGVDEEWLLFGFEGWGTGPAWTVLHDGDGDEDDPLEVTKECLFELSKRVFKFWIWIELLGGVGGRRGITGQGTARGPRWWLGGGWWRDGPVDEEPPTTEAEVTWEDDDEEWWWRWFCFRIFCSLFSSTILCYETFLLRWLARDKSTRFMIRRRCWHNGLDDDRPTGLYQMCVW